ncbi:bacteriocin immunity protein [Vibrio spartinae]|uniref:Colicin-E2 immunity protein n=1 Tax=Vibrio spartinae TaxID=1918945 RepID=A0A1N6M6Z3_9VIBR|nr:bacteriocin immunity protein [Vibrio spartinae]SIO95218.1 Colicin-E2 immunity protein [Vibrio spartinae]
MKLKDSLQDYTENEFLITLEWFWDGEGSEEDEFVYQFNQIVRHPEKSALLTHPKSHQEDSPEGVIQELKRWYAEQGLPCFKD